ncbi:MAG: CCA tRNA nucleotidyltransferase, partial [Syntrophales bacterium]|nr:CCA tRNA nucleotidyltransferase [Syntrophales bacterium]
MTSPPVPDLFVTPLNTHPYCRAAAIVARLRDHGHEAYFVGGCVRDMIMGAEPEDYDIVTSATPEKVMALFERTIAVGAAFGVVLVIVDGKGHEVATFRTEGGYTNGRHPLAVTFTGIEEDVKRRDFTVNGLFMDPFNGRVVDRVGGIGDIAARLIRTIGNPAERFDEDHLRMLRAVRFAAWLDFAVDPLTLQAIKDGAHHIRRISAERIREELTRIITRRGARRGMELLKDCLLYTSPSP